MPEPVISIACDVPGHDGEAVQFKRKGWKFKHHRMWQEALTGAGKSDAELAEFVSERIQGWNLTDEDGKFVAFQPGRGALDELPPALAVWVVEAFRDAYIQAGVPDPN
jgi:hypothetical protein